MPSTRALLIVSLVWAAIYLPRLGSLELKSEEGRRVLPAVTMMQTGNYIVPFIGSEPYLRKPPLVNWLVAASFKIFGMPDEWTARLPSALCVLSVALAFLFVARRALGPNGSLAAAMMWLTNFGLLEKGRLIEIEALYVSLAAVAFICWLSWWNEPRRRWRAWILSGIFLGLALLAKGPLALLFFYSVVVAVLWKSKKLAQFWSVPHLAGFVLMVVIFAGWAVPYFLMTEAGHAAGVWSRQFSGRLTGDDFKLTDWILNIPRGIAYLLPWIALFPFVRFVELENEEEQIFARALSLGITVPFVIVSLVPGDLPRYTMPLLAPAIWLLALFIRAHALVWPQQLRRVITWTVATVTVAMVSYSLAIVPLLLKREKVRPLARKLESVIPPNDSLYAVDPDYQPFLFYLHRPIVYVHRVADLPRAARWLLVRPENEEAAEQAQQWSPQQAKTILQLKDYRNRRVILLEVRPPATIRGAQALGLDLRAAGCTARN